MADFDLERRVRTAYSEVYAILDEDDQVGRIDIHFTYNVVEVCLVVDESLTQETIRELVETIDGDLLDAAGIPREEMLVHVFQGNPLGVFTNREFGTNGSDS